MQDTVVSFYIGLSFIMLAILIMFFFPTSVGCTRCIQWGCCPQSVPSVWGSSLWAVWSGIQGSDYLDIIHLFFLVKTVRYYSFNVANYYHATFNLTKFGFAGSWTLAGWKSSSSYWKFFGWKHSSQLWFTPPSQAAHCGWGAAGC